MNPLLFFLFQDVWSIFCSFKHSNTAQVDLSGLGASPHPPVWGANTHAPLDHERNLQVLPGPRRAGQALMCWWHYHFLINTSRRRQKASCLTPSLRRFMETAAGAAQTWAVKPCWHVSPLHVIKCVLSAGCTFKVSRWHVIPLNTCDKTGIVDSFSNPGRKTRDRASRWNEMRRNSSNLWWVALQWLTTRRSRRSMESCFQEFGKAFPNFIHLFSWISANATVVAR